MNAMTPLVTERSILELLADPEMMKARAAELLQVLREAETVQAKAIAAKIEADQAFKAAADEVTKQRELQAINTGKSQKLAEEQAALADKVASHEANKADDVKRLGEWERRLKDQQAALDERDAAVTERFRQVENELRDLAEAKREAQALIDKAEAIRAAMG